MHIKIYKLEKSKKQHLSKTDLYIKNNITPQANIII